MTAIPWSATGLDHQPRVVLPIPGPSSETCMNHPDTPVSPDHTDASLCAGCGGDTAHAIEQARHELMREHGLDVRPEPWVRWSWAGGV